MRTFAIVAVLEGAVPDLAEWLAAHRAVGVRHVVIYDDGLDAEAAAILTLHAALGVITLPCPHRFDCTPTFAAYDHFLASRARLFRFSAFLDADEFLMPPPGRTLDGWLARIPAHAGAVVINRRVFDTAHPIDPADLMLRRFPRALAGDDDGANRVVRSIYRRGAVSSIRNAHREELVQGERLMSDFSPAEADPQRDDAVLGIRHGEIRLNHYPRAASAAPQTEPCPRTAGWIGPTLDEMRHLLAYADGVAPAEAARLRARYATVPELARPVSAQEHRRWRLRHLYRPQVEAAGRFVRRKIFGSPRPW